MGIRQLAAKALMVLHATGVLVPVAAMAGEAPPYLGYDGKLRVVHVGAVAPDILGVTLWAGKIIYGDQIPYKKEKGDKIDRNGHQRWVIRDGSLLGSLVGREEKLIYTVDRYVGDRLDGAWADASDSYQLTSRGSTSSL